MKWRVWLNIEAFEDGMPDKPCDGHGWVLREFTDERQADAFARRIDQHFGSLEHLRQISERGKG